MKHWMTLALALALTAPVTAGAVSSQDLTDISRYRPVHVTSSGIVYADMTSVKQGDPVEGRLPMLQVDLYYESYQEAPTYEQITGGQLVDVIYAYHGKLLAVRSVSDATGLLQFYGDNRIFGIFQPDGQPANRAPQTGEAKGIEVAGGAEDIYLNLYRWI